MTELKRLFDLQMFSEDEAPAGDESKDAGKTPDGDGEKPKDKPQPFAIFPDQKSFMARVEREARKIHKQTLADLGVDSPEALKSMLDTYRELEATSNADLMERDQRIKDLEEENQTLIGKITSGIKQEALKTHALALGVNEERFERFTRLIDMNAIEIVEGAVVEEPLKQQITTLLDEFPEFRGVTPASQGGSDFNDNQGDKPLLTMDKIKSMSTQEILDNYEEVMKVMGTQK